MLMHTPWRLATALLLLALNPLAHGADDFSKAEQLIFMSDQLKLLKPPTTLRYSFHKTGRLEAGFDDSVTLNFSAQADGSCCSSQADFLTGARRMDMPTIEGAKGNPVILYFLERDIREMQRLTKGQANHFRKRIRMAIYQGAVVKDVTLSYRGQAIKGQEVTLSPYLDDPNRPRYERLAQKQYVFSLSDAVPGGVYSLRAHIAAPTSTPSPSSASSPSSPASTLMMEELLIEGATSAEHKNGKAS